MLGCRRRLIENFDQDGGMIRLSVGRGKSGRSSSPITFPSSHNQVLQTTPIPLPSFVLYIGLAYFIGHDVVQTYHKSVENMDLWNAMKFGLLR